MIRVFYWIGWNADDDKNVEDTHELCKISKILFFDGSFEIWFFQDEAEFQINGIVSEKIKFNYLVSQLEPKFNENIWDIVTNNFAKKLTESKTRLLDFFKKSEITWIKKLITVIDLGNLKSSQLLQKLKFGNRYVTIRLRILAIFCWHNF